jgi:hypothetical protein
MATDEFSGLLNELILPRPWDPTPTRNELAERIPRVVNAAIASHHPRLDEARGAMPGVIWRSLVDGQAGATSNGWTEVVASMAVAIELLTESLPPEVRAHVSRFPQIEAEVRRRLLPFERYALLIGGPGQIARAHVDARAWAVDPTARLERVEQQPGIEWAIDAPSFRGRSHTLLLALLALDARERVLPDDIAIALTGELANDGVTVLPVDGFEAKVVAWRTAHPQGLLISAPPPLPVGREAAARETQRAADLPGDGEWIVGATLGEITAKLLQYGRNRREGRRVRVWDGSLRTMAQLASWRLARRRVDGSGSPGARLPGDRVEAQIAQALSVAQAPQGIVIRGAPGTGKSLLLEVLEDAFIATALGCFGYAVVVRAAELARGLASAAEIETLLAVRSRLSPATLDGLLRARRLFVLIDGLDEIDDNSLDRISAWLQDGGVRFLATSRPTRTLGSLPPCTECEIAPLNLEAARALLRAEGRPDLAAFATDRVGYLRDAQVPAEVMALLDTPLGVSLLAAATPAEADLRAIDPPLLYEQVFDKLLAHGSRSGRLRPEGARFLQRGGRRVGARLAFQWLRDGRDVSRAAICHEVERAGYQGGDADHLAEALEFGHLIVPGAEGFCFAHRTLAEWLAAGRLDELVTTTIDREPSRPVGDVEDEALDALLPREALAGSPWWQTALFFAPYTRAPDRLIRRVLRGAHDGHPGNARHSSRERFAAALRLASLCRWQSAEAAQDTWALFTRALTVPFDDEEVRPSPLLQERPRPDFVWERFLAAVARHLPSTLDGLCDVAGVDEPWRQWFRDRQERLLRAVPRERLALFEARLRSPNIETRTEILQRHVELDERVAWRTHAILRDEAPPAMPTEAHGAAARWEAALFDYWIAVGEQIPPAWLIARAGAWPAHLQDPLTRWMNAAGELGEGIRDRAAAMERFVVSVVTEREQLLVGLRQIARREDHVAVFGAMCERLDVSSPDCAVGTLRALIEEVGVEISRSRSFRSNAPDDAVVLSDEVRAWDRRHRAMKHTLGQLDVARREEILAGVFEHLRLGSPERRYVVLLCLEIDRVPPEVSVDELIDVTDRPSRGLAYHLLPNERRAPISSHTARWREIAAIGRGRRRLLALEWCARLDGADLASALLGATPRDDEFAALRREHLIESADALSSEQIATLDDEIRRALPLRVRVRARVSGWQADVVAALDAEADVARREALAIVRQERLVATRACLLVRFDLAPEAGVCTALEALVDSTDRDLIRRLLAYEARGWEPGERLLSLMELDDLTIFLSRLSVPWRADEAGGARMKQLGAPAHRLIRGILNEAGNADARRKKELRRLLVLTAAPEVTTIGEFASLAREALGGDRHVVSSQSGSLGSDFDDYPDQDFHSDLEDREVITLLFQQIDARLAREREEKDGLRALFDHPSETVQVEAYSRLAKIDGPVAAARLGLQLLEGHTLRTRTEVVGDVVGLALGGLGSGAGENYVDTRAARRRLLDAVREQLSPLAAKEVRSWLESKVAAVRRLALGWLAEIGAPKDDALFQRALRDPDAEVVFEALVALTRIAPLRDWSTLLVGLVSTWGAVQVLAAGQWWLRRDRSIAPEVMFNDRLIPWPVSADLTVVDVSAQIMAGRLLIDTARMIDATLCDERHQRLLARTMDPLLRRLEEFTGSQLSSERWPSEALSCWAVDASPGMRRVWVQAMARRGMPAVEPMLRAMFDADDPVDRCVALVELSALGCRDLLGRLEERWRRVMARSWSPEGKEIPAEERPNARQIFEVLLRGPVEFAWLFPHISALVDFDEEADIMTSEGVAILRRLAPSIRRWGEQGFKVLLEASAGLRPAGDCARTLLLQLGDELPPTIRAQIDASGPQELEHGGWEGADELYFLRTQLNQRSASEEDIVTAARVTERIGWST